MMELSGLGGSPTKLLEALEKLGVSAGAELRSPSGPGGMPDAEVTRLFESLLQGQGSESNTVPDQTLSTRQAASPDDIPASEQGLAVGTGEEAPSGMVSEVRGPLSTEAPEWPGPAEKIPGNELVDSGRTAQSGALDGADMLSGERRTASLSAVHETETDPIEGRELPEMAPREDLEGKLREVAELLDTITSGQATPVDLYRMQYLVGMLHVQFSTGSQATQQVEQGVQSVLKQQG